MASAMAKSPVRTLVPRWLPSEHGFWVMLGAALASAILRAKGDRLSLLVAALGAVAAISAGGLSHRQIRKSSAAQLAATVLLALCSVPVELAAGLPFPSIAAAAFARGVVFVTSALIVRAAFARSARNGSHRSLFLRVGALVIAILAAALLFFLGRMTEAVTCLIAACAYAVFVWSPPTAKQLKPLGLTLGWLALASAITLAL
jgi:succinate dehydrogenase hydrophobic anchor subunit